MATQSPWIINASSETFQTDVVERSMQVPVVIDFWAPWCGPCRQLAPMLEKLAEEFQGQFVLAKINTDESPDLAQAFQIQSIPLVVAIHEGKVVDQFMGVQPEDSLRSWLEALVPSRALQLLKQGEAVEPQDPAGAESLYRDALAAEPENDAVKVALARVTLALGRPDESRAFIDELEARGFLESEAERVKAQLDIEAAAADTGGVEAARAAAQANPDNLPLQIALADALAASRKFQEALEICLQVIQRDRDGVGVQAKDTMLKIFELLGPHSDLVGAYRRKLATLLY